MSFHPGHIEILQESDLVPDLGQGLDPVERHPCFESLPQVGPVGGPTHGPDQPPGSVQRKVQSTGGPFGQAATAIPGSHLPIVQLLQIGQSSAVSRLISAWRQSIRCSI